MATAAGDLSANALQILAAGFGLAAVISSFQYGFAAIKWAGVCYLVWVGVRQILASYKAQGHSPNVPNTSLRQLWFRGFVTSAANPKAVVFFAALFPQFLDQGQSLAPQLAILGVTYIVIDGCFLLCYGKGASWLGAKLQSQHKVWVDRAAGASLICAAILLSFRSSQRS